MGLITGDIDRIREFVPDFYLPNLYNEVIRQTTMLGLKGVFGSVCVFGTLLVASIICYRIWQKRNLAAMGKRKFFGFVNRIYNNRA